MNVLYSRTINFLYRIQVSLKSLKGKPSLVAKYWCTILKQLMDLHSVTLIINYLFVSFRIRRSSVCLYLSYHPFIMSEDSNFISFIFIAEVFR